MINFDLKVHTGYKSLREIADYYKTGKWISFQKWLQRLEQEKKWTKQDKANAKAYLSGLLMTNGCLQGFLVCDIDFLIRDIIEQKSDKPELDDIWKEMIEWLEEKKEIGAEAVILDGQNRLKFSITPFIYGNLTIPLVIDGVEKNDVSFTSLSDTDKQQVNNHQVIVSYAIGGNVLAVVERLIAINEGESWSPHEKRCIQFTPVAYSINKTISHPDIVHFMSRLDELGVFSSTYSLQKKGDSLFVAEHLHYLRHQRVGDKKSLDTLYNESDDKLTKEMKITNELFLWMARNFPKNKLTKNFRGEVLRDLFIFISMLTNKDTKRSSEISYNIKLSMIKSPEVLLSMMIQKIEDILSDKPRNITPITRNGMLVYLSKNAIPTEFLGCHKNFDNGSMDGRLRIFIPEFNKILDECVENQVIVTKDPRRISKYDRQAAAAKYDGDMHERFKTTNLDSTLNKELDHIVSVKKGGSSDDDNLTFTSKNNNRRKGG